MIIVTSAKVKENKILITNNYMKKTIENLKHNNKISLVVLDDNLKGCNIEGTAKHFTKGKEYDYIKNIKENKGEPCKGVIIITPRKIKEI